ncbi:hypothetical protein V3C99_018375, partial [Haemonchus contortus]
KTILLFKKGDKGDLDNYRPITLLPVINKVFTRCLLARIRRKLDEAQPVEQAGFRRKFSTLDHIITCCRIIEAAREHHEPLKLTFIDYQKAFDSIEREKIWSVLNEQGIDPRYTEILKECYSGCVTVFRPSSATGGDCGKRSPPRRPYLPESFRCMPGIHYTSLR